MKKVLILGSLGMVGHIVNEYLSLKDEYEIFTVDRQSIGSVSKKMDVTDFYELHLYLEYLKPDVVINCIGILVKESNENITNAIMINSLLPQKLKEWGDILDYYLIHLSTDCVFSGKDGDYIEDSFRDGDDYYARTKALGEIFSNKHLTIRTSIIGPEIKADGTGLLDWFLKQKMVIRGYTQVYWTGVTTLQLAKIIDQILKRSITGIYHVTSHKKICKYELLKICGEVFEKNILIEKDDSYVSDKSLVNTRKDYIYSELNYKAMLIELRDWMIKNSVLYRHYGF